jgi:SAM-dependent methyltransferase
MPDQIDSNMLTHYEEGRERERLFQGLSQLERVRTEELLLRYLPPAPATILDVGGGPGAYARWLTGRGYEVHLIDPVPLHVDQAGQIEPGVTPIASARIGDARTLDQLDASVDAVLMLGPLYHLTERSDRIQALREAKRVLRPGGMLFAVGISRFTSLLDGMSFELLNDPEFARIVAQDLQDGQHRNPNNRPFYFTTAFFHHPDELRAEVAEAGFSIANVVGIEGIGWWMARDFSAWWNVPERRERLLSTIRAVESEPSLLGLGPHLMVIGSPEG